MNDTRSRRQLEQEVEALRRRVVELEREQTLTAGVLERDLRHLDAPLLEQVPAIIWRADVDLRLVWWTGGGIASLGVKSEEWIGADIFAFFGTDDPTHPSIAAHRAALRGVPISYDTERDGVFFSAHTRPQYDATGTIIGVVGVSIETTDRVRAESDLRHALEQVRELSGLIPICMHCKSVRDESGRWDALEDPVPLRSLAEFTHAICPDCMKRELAQTGIG